jgi:hypothetical protein
VRRRHVIAVLVVLIIGIGAKQFFFPATKAAADAIPSVSMDVMQMHHDIDIKNIPVQKMHDMTFVFTEGD